MSLCEERHVFDRKLAAWPVWTCCPAVGIVRGPEEGRVRDATMRLRVDGAVEQRPQRTLVGERERTVVRRIDGAGERSCRAWSLAVDRDAASRVATDAAAELDAPVRLFGGREPDARGRARRRPEPAEAARLGQELPYMPAMEVRATTGQRAW